MAKFKVVTHKLTGASFGVSGEGYKLEMEASAPIDAEIIEIPATTEDDFIRAARGCRCDHRQRRAHWSILSTAWTSACNCTGQCWRIPWTWLPLRHATFRSQMPDTFIEEVADHAMMYSSPRSGASLLWTDSSVKGVGAKDGRCCRSSHASWDRRSALSPLVTWPGRPRCVPGLWRAHAGLRSVHRGTGDSSMALSLSALLSVCSA